MQRGDGRGARIKRDVLRVNDSGGVVSTQLLFNFSFFCGSCLRLYVCLGV